MLKFYWLIMHGSSKPAKPKAPRNRTIELEPGEAESLRSSLLFDAHGTIDELRNTDVNSLSADESKELLARIRDKII